MTTSEPPAQLPRDKDPVRVLLVDDSAVVRAFLRRFIEEDPALQVSAAVGNGERAIGMMARGRFDVVVLDIEMPVMDGLTALPQILKADPDVQVIIASTLTKENAVITLKCFQAGAAECLAKPTSEEMAASDLFKQSLVAKVKALGAVARRKRGNAPPPPAAARGAPPAVRLPVPAGPKAFSLRAEVVRAAPEVVAVGSSTGGPQALIQFFADLKKPLKQPVFVTQHMPPTFTTILAEHIGKTSGLTCREARDGERVEGGVIYLAPGNYHLTVRDGGGEKVIALSQDPPENFCRPAVDPMLRSLVDAYGRRVLAAIFTGMGSDGLQGCRRVVEAGGAVIAQDEASSVVWGMPGAVAMAGICTRVLPLDAMAGAVREHADRAVQP